MNQLRCYSREELTSFIQGKLPDEFSTEISQHLDDCDVCEDTIVNMEQTSDSLMASLQDAATDATRSPSPYQNNPDFEQAKRAVQQVVHQAEVDQEDWAAAPQKIGDYQVLETLARGGMGSVFKARHTRLEKMVAIKILPERKMRSPDAVARFNREMKIIGQMSHPSMVTAFDAGDDQGVHYLAMELVDGMDLGQIVRRCGALSIANGCELIRQSSLGIQYAHDGSVIHRDVKPSNLMLTSDGQIKVLDLGLATLSGLNGAVDELTTVGQLMGTLNYMSPEQCGSADDVTYRSDIYGLSATLYKLLTATAPYTTPETDTPLKKLRAMATQSHVPILDRRSDLPIELAELIDRGLASKAENRFESAGEFAEQLKPFCEGHRLAELLKQARSVGDESPVKTPRLDLSSLTHRFHTRSVAASQSTDLKETAESSGRSVWKQFLRAACLLLMLGGITYGGIVLYINTATGQLVITSDVDDIEVSVVKNDSITKKLKIEQKLKTTRLFAGQYRIDIKGDSDSLIVDNGEFALKRGEKVVVRIKEKPLDDTTPAKSATFTDTPDLVSEKPLENESSPSQITYRKQDLRSWIESALSAVTSPRNSAVTPIKILATQTKPEYQKAVVSSFLKKYRREVSPSEQQKLIAVLSLLAGQDDVAQLLSEYVLDLSTRPDVIGADKIGATRLSLASALHSIGKTNSTYVQKRMTNAAGSDDSNHQALAVYWAAAADDGKLPLHPWLKTLMAAAESNDDLLGEKSLLVICRTFGDRREVNELVTQLLGRHLEEQGVWPRCISFLLDARPNDLQIAEKYVRSVGPYMSPAQLWRQAISRLTLYADNRLVEAIASCLDEPTWNCDEFNSDSIEASRTKASYQSIKGQFRVLLRSTKSSRQGLIRAITLKSSSKSSDMMSGLMGGGGGGAMIGSGGGSMLGGMMSNQLAESLSQKSLSDVHRDYLKKRLLPLLKRQAENPRSAYSQLSPFAFSQLNLEIDLKIAELSELETTTHGSDRKASQVTPPIFQGHTIEYWTERYLSGKNDESKQKALDAIVELSSFADDAKALLTKLVPTFRGLSFTPREANNANSLAATALSLCGPQQQFIRLKRRRSSRTSSLLSRSSSRGNRHQVGTLTLALIDDIDTFDSKDAPYLLQVLKQHRGESIDDQKVLDFLLGQAASENDSDQRLALSLYFRFTKNSTISQPLLFDLLRNKEHDTSIKLAWMMEHIAGQFYDVRNKRILITKISEVTDWLNDPAQLTRYLEFMVNDPPNWRTRESTQQPIVGPLLIRILAENKPYLDQAHASENYDIWEGKRIPKDASSPPPSTKMIDLMLPLLENAGLWHQFLKDDPDRTYEKQFQAAIKTMKERASKTTTVKRSRLERIIIRMEKTLARSKNE